MMKVSRPPFKHSKITAINYYKIIFLLPAAALMGRFFTDPLIIKRAVFIFLFFIATALIKYYFTESTHLKRALYIYGIWAVYTALLTGLDGKLLNLFLSAALALFIYEIVFSSQYSFPFPPFIIIWLVMNYFFSADNYLNINIYSSLMIYVSISVLLFKSIYFFKELFFVIVSGLLLYLFGPFTLKASLINISAVLLLLVYPGMLPLSRIKRYGFISAAVALYFFWGLAGIAGLLLLIPAVEKL